MAIKEIPHILDLEDYAFNLLNQLTDEYGAIDENGSFAHAIQETNDPLKMQRIIERIIQVVIGEYLTGKTIRNGEPKLTIKVEKS